MKESFWQKPRNILITALIATFLWGCAPSVIKTGYSVLQLNPQDTASILVFAGYRFTLAGIMVILINSVMNKKLILPKKEAFQSIGVLSFFQTFGQYFVYYLGVARTTGVNASIITGTGALISLLFAVFLFKSENMTKNKLLGCLIGFSGIILMNIGKGSFNISLMGDFLCICSQICYSLSACFMKVFSKHHDAVMLSGYQFFIGGLALTIVGTIFGGHIELQGTQIYMILIYLGLISAVAYTLWGVLLAHNPVSKIGIFGCMTPVFGVIVSAFVLNEFSQAISINSLAALVLIVFALYLVNHTKPIKE